MDTLSCASYTEACKQILIDKTYIPRILSVQRYVYIAVYLPMDFSCYNALKKIELHVQKRFNIVILSEVCSSCTTIVLKVYLTKRKTN